MGFRQELAVTMANSKRVPLTRSHIAQQTGISEQHVRRGLVELEQAGLAERRPINGGTLLKGNIEIYSWAQPREPKTKFGSQRAAPKPVWFPTSWEPFEPLLKRLRIGLLPDLGPDQETIVEEGARIARDLQNAELGAARFLKGVRAQKCLYKDERTERNIERTVSSSSSSSCTVEETPAPIPTPSSTTTNLISDTIDKHNIPADAAAVETLIFKCRENKPDATEAEICRAVDLKAPISKEKKNPIGFLLTAVANCFAGGASPPLVMASAAGAETVDQRKNREFWESMERRQPKPCPTT